MIELQIGELPDKDKLKRRITGKGTQYLFYVDAETQEPVVVATMHKPQVLWDFLKEQSEQFAEVMHAYYSVKSGGEGIRAKEGRRRFVSEKDFPSPS